MLQRNQKPPPAGLPGGRSPAAAGLVYRESTAPTGADGHGYIGFS